MGDRNDDGAAGQDPARHKRAIADAIERNDKETSSLVVSSWRRCVGEYGLDHIRHKGPEIVTAQELKCAAGPLDLLRHVAKPEIDQLLSRVAAASYVTVLSDANGVALDVGTTMPVDVAMRRVGICAGAVWEEPLAGTNGIGTSLTTRKPVTIHRDEHFFVNYTTLTCTAAPIVNWDGETLAALDVSAIADLPKEMQAFVLSLVEGATRRIERRYFLARNKDRPMLRIERRLDDVGHSDGLLIALGDDGLPAEILSGFAEQADQFSHARIIGKPLSDFMDINWQDVAPEFLTDGVVERIGIARIPSLNSPCFASLRLPKARPSSAKASKAAQPPAARPRPTSRTSGTLSLDALAGADPVLQSHVEILKKLVDRRLPILLQGETGTGKEEFARGIHHASARAAGPFVAIDCSSIPDSLIESELFGYETGTFTGGRREGRRGRIAEANGGTIFLDEIGDMPLPLQTRLLRVLAQRELVPLGASKPVKIDFNVICASHQNLPGLIAEGRFRQDLYFRIAGVRIELPPLRRRRDRESVIKLATAIEAEEMGLERCPEISQAAMAMLMAYPWTGNIRELRLAMRYALANLTAGDIDVDDLPHWLVEREGDRPSAAGPGPSAAGEREPDTPEHLAAILERHDWCVTDAAAALNVSRQTLYRWMRRLRLSRPI